MNLQAQVLEAMEELRMASLQQQGQAEKGAQEASKAADPSDEELQMVGHTARPAPDQAASGSLVGLQCVRPGQLCR